MTFPDFGTSQTPGSGWQNYDPVKGTAGIGARNPAPSQNAQDPIPWYLDPFGYAQAARDAAKAASGVDPVDIAKSAAGSNLNGLFDQIDADVKRGALGIALYILLAIGLFALVWPGQSGQIMDALKKAGKAAAA